MNKIRILPDNLANQIAAGEVVERPAAVGKELVENAIDAGATRLQIDIELGGRRLMQVTDDGEGMVRDDAILAFERHATSKISTLEDLAMIGTLGFRGEALASIASVAKVELTTKTDSDNVATCVVVEGGRLVDVKDAARDRGTTIMVRDLFFNTPARRKFMRSEATENYHLTGIVTHYALAHPEIAFTLTNNGREVLRVSRANDLRERAFQVFGRDLIESLLPVDGGREYVARITGFVSAPRERRTTRDAQYFFVNNRFVRDKTIAGGLLEGYRSVLPHGVYPVAFLFVDVPLEEVDVNVHPAKTEVRFRRSEAVKDAIAEAIRNALASAGIVAQAEAYSEANDERSVSAVAVGSVEQFSNVDQAKMYFGFDPDGPIAEWPERPDQTMGRSHEQATPGLAPPTDLPDLLDSDDLSFAYEGTQNAPEDNVNEEAPGSSGRLLAETKIEGLGSFPPINSAEKLQEPLMSRIFRVTPCGPLHNCMTALSLRSTMKGFFL